MPERNLGLFQGVHVPYIVLQSVDLIQDQLRSFLLVFFTHNDVSFIRDFLNFISLFFDRGLGLLDQHVQFFDCLGLPTFFLSLLHIGLVRRVQFELRLLLRGLRLTAASVRLPIRVASIRLGLLLAFLNFQDRLRRLRGWNGRGFKYFLRTVSSGAEAVSVFGLRFAGGRHVLAISNVGVDIALMGDRVSPRSIALLDASHFPDNVLLYDVLDALLILGVQLAAVFQKCFLVLREGQLVYFLELVKLGNAQAVEVFKPKLRALNIIVVGSWLALGPAVVYSDALGRYFLHNFSVCSGRD